MDGVYLTHCLNTGEGRLTVLYDHLAWFILHGNIYTLEIQSATFST